MYKYKNAPTGLYVMYIAQIGSIVSAIITVLFSQSFVLSIIGALATLVFAIIYLIGLNTAGKDIDGCKTAFIITIINIIVSVVGLITGQKGFTDLLGYIFNILVVYNVCTSVATILRTEGKEYLAEKGQTAWIMFLVADLIEIVCYLLAFVRSLYALAFILILVSLIVLIVSSIIYIGFLKNSSEALQNIYMGDTTES